MGHLLLSIHQLQVLQLIHSRQLPVSVLRPVTMDILITTQITPTFTQIGPLGQNSTAPALPWYI